MRKRKFIQRVQVLGPARSAYLEFLRNLTPQALLFTFVAVTMEKLDFTRFDMSNWFPTLGFYLLVFYFAIAVYANTTMFREKCVGRNKIWFRRASRAIERHEFAPLKRVGVHLQQMWKRRKVEVMEEFLVFYLLQISLAIVIVVGARSAAQILAK